MLAWTRMRSSCNQLQLVFGMAFTSVCMYLRFGRRMLLNVLSNDENAKVEIPDEGKLNEYVNIIKVSNYSLLLLLCCLFF